MLRTVSVAALAALLLLPGRSQGDEPKLTPTSFNVVRLSGFWGLERFLVDEDEPVVLKPTLEGKVLAKAPSDECFNGIGQPYDCLATSIAKKNQSYVWGLVKAGNSLWFGTMANVPCWATASMLPLIAPGLTLQNDNYVCEYGQAQSGTGDWRPPHVYRFDLGTRTLQDLSAAAASVLGATQGIRSAALSPDGSTVLFGGPAQANPLVDPWATSGVNLLAFDVASGAFLGSKHFAEYGDIRSWVNMGGVLYTGVSNAAAASPADPGGFVLRWRGTRDADPTPDELFVFEEVGSLDTEAANLAEFHGRLFVTTWPKLIDFSTALASRKEAGLWMSPVVPSGGLSYDHADDWTRVFKMSDYDPDPLVSKFALGGALAAYRDGLYFGTMLAPFTGTGYAVTLHQMRQVDLDANGNGSLDVDELLATALGTHRSAALFKLTEPGTSGQKLRLLYGERFLPVYDAQQRSYTIEYDDQHASPLGQVPQFGASGFGNFFNAYVWSMKTFGDDLYVGTFDWSQVARSGLLGFLGLPVQPAPTPDFLLKALGARLPAEGADLVRIRGSGGHAMAESLNGLGNYTNYGVRTMVSTPDRLYVGTANANNVAPNGGFELIELKPRK